MWNRKWRADARLSGSQAGASTSPSTSPVPALDLEKDRGAGHVLVVAAQSRLGAHLEPGLLLGVPGQSRVVEVDVADRIGVSGLMGRVAVHAHERLDAPACRIEEPLRDEKLVFVANGRHVRSVYRRFTRSPAMQ